MQRVAFDGENQAVVEAAEGGEARGDEGAGGAAAADDEGVGEEAAVVALVLGRGRAEDVHQARVGLPGDDSFKSHRDLFRLEREVRGGIPRLRPSTGLGAGSG